MSHSVCHIPAPRTISKRITYKWAATILPPCICRESGGQAIGVDLAATLTSERGELCPVSAELHALFLLVKPTSCRIRAFLMTRSKLLDSPVVTKDAYCNAQP